MFSPSTRILIVDDMKSQRAAVRTALRAIGFLGQINETDNGERAFNTLVENCAQGMAFELIISDWNMEGGTGIEFLRKVRSHPNFLDLPFLMVTAEAQPSQVMEAAKLGVSN
ncbi:response regulator [Bdellovibrionota bacterium FG-2]